jgi:excisionase family DNA binding protein
MFTGCGFVFTMDADAGKAAEWLVLQRRDSASAELPEGDAFTPANAAKLLGITKSALARSLRRHKLDAIGNGKARRLPRATVETARYNSPGIPTRS